MGFRSARIKSGRKVKEVMEALGVTDAAVYMWETGVTHPKTANLMKLAHLYGCSVEELLTPDTPKDNGLTAP